MDIFIEKIVKRKNGLKEYALIFALILAAVFVSFFAVVFLIDTLQTITFILIAAIIYGLWYLIGLQNIEFEYSLTNGELDIDTIINRRKRNRILGVNCKDFEIVAPYTDENIKQYSGASVSKKIFACSSLNDDGLYFIVTSSKMYGKTLLVFQPDERMLNAFKTFIPKKVIL